MSDLIEQLSFIVPVISISYVIVITSINVYFKIRRKFPAIVNCWFCNINTKVPYSHKNCWECPHCDQYNGFSDDGDYNCDIPAMRNIKLNSWSSAVSQKTDSKQTNITKNGLCASCNRNQEIKIQQLATFIPEYEQNYDEEIVEFSRKLEQAYRLCFRCDHVLKRTLNKVKNNVLGSKLAQIGAKGLSIFDLHMAANNKQTISHKKRIFTNISLNILIILSLINLIQIGQTTGFTKTKLDSIFPSNVTHVFLVILSYISAAKIVFLMFLNDLINNQFFFEFFQYFNSILAIYADVFNSSLVLSNFYNQSKDFITKSTEKLCDSSVIVDFTGILLLVYVLLINGLKKNGPVLVLLLWSFKMMLPTIENQLHEHVNDVILDLGKITIASLALIISIINRKNSKTLMKDIKVNNSFHRIYSECNSEISDNSDNENDLTPSPNSFKSKRQPYRQTPTPQKSPLNSTKSLSPSIFTPSVLRQNMVSSLNVLNKSIDSNYGSNHLKNIGGSVENMFDGRQNNVNYFTNNCAHRCHYQCDGYTNRTPSDYLNTSQKSFNLPKFYDNTSKKCASMNALNSGYDVSDDFQRRINGLNINDNNYNTTYSRQMPPLPTQSILRQRKEVISPSRLHMNNTPAPPQSVTQASWVAGGYWNSTSPQKKLLQPNPTKSHTGELYPIMSRTSSQSSGFESQASSLLNGHENFSRESSICGDVDRTSVFSEPSYCPDSASHMGSQNMLNSTFSMNGNNQNLPQQIFPVLDASQHTFIHPSSVLNNSMYESTRPKLEDSSSILNKSQPIVYHQFGTQRVGNLNASNCLFNFNKLTNNLPPIQKGSLLRNWKENSRLDVSENL